MSKFSREKNGTQNNAHRMCKAFSENKKYDAVQCSK